MMAEAGMAIGPEMAVLGDADATLRRFLRARKFKLEAAFNMLESERRFRFLGGWGAGGVVDGG
jgi:hypothetical protein